MMLNTILHGCAAEGRIALGQDILDRIFEWSMTPSDMTFVGALRLASVNTVGGENQKLHTQRLLEVWRALCERMDAQPGLDVQCALSVALARVGDISGALTNLQEIVKHEFTGQVRVCERGEVLGLAWSPQFCSNRA